MSQRFMHGSPILLGDNTVPGVELPEDLKKYCLEILEACRNYGLDFYPTVVQLLTHDEMSEIAAYGGFPVRYPHWRYGMEYNRLQQSYQYGLSKIFEMVVNCLDPKTRIPTARGSLAAAEVVAGDTIYSHNGPRTVAKVVKQSSAPTVKIGLKGQQRNLICTLNHKWLVMKKTGPEWLEASNIAPGDLLIGGDTYRHFQGVPAKLSWSSTQVIQETNPKVRNRLKLLSEPKEMTLPLAELLGVITDGSQSVKGRENIISVVVGKDFPEFLMYVRGLFSAALNEDTLVEDKPTCMVVSLCSKMAVDFVDYLGIPKGCTYKTKRIPWSIWASSNEYRAAYLRGLFDTDGYASSCLGFSCYNKELGEDVQLMLSEMGIYSTLNERDNGDNKIWVLNLQGRESIFKYRQRIGFSMSHKINELEKLIDTESCVDGGFEVPWLQQQIVEIGEKCGITTYNNPSLGSSIKNMQKGLVGLNAMYGFVLRAWQSGYSEFSEIYQWLSNPFYKVESVLSHCEMETVDIALFDNTHDFMANGIVSHNTNPCYIYCLASNPLVDNLTVVAHATGHNDFFKNNICFENTDTTMMSRMANHGNRIRRYMSRWGQGRVTDFIDHILRLDTLIDPAAARKDREVHNKKLYDVRTYRQPRRIEVEEDHLYMEPFVNTSEFRKSEKERIQREDIADELDVFRNPTRDILGFLRDNAPLKPWQADIASMLYEEAMYFYPQRQTKVMNEGWASRLDHEIMVRQGYVSLGQKANDMGIVDYARHKAIVLGGKYSTNPYKLGYELFNDIEKRWDKGRFGPEWEECRDIHQKENWDTKAGLGKEKIFEVRKYYDDVTFIHEFFTEEFCRQQEYYQYKRFPEGEYKIDTRNYKTIKKSLMQKHLNAGLPDIRLVEPNYKGKGGFLMEHNWSGSELYDPYVRDVMNSICFLWGNDVFLTTRNKNGDRMVYCCQGTNEEDVVLMTEEEYVASW